MLPYKYDENMYHVHISLFIYLIYVWLFIHDMYTMCLNAYHVYEYIHIAVTDEAENTVFKTDTVFSFITDSLYSVYKLHY